MSKYLFEYYKEGFTLNYTNFKGRARRREMWGFVLFDVIVNLGLLFVLSGIGQALEMPLLAVLILLYRVAVLLPETAVLVRRLHDIGKSGRGLFVALIPLVGVFVVLYWLCKKGQDFENQYGPNPKALDE